MLENINNKSKNMKVMVLCNTTNISTIHYTNNKVWGFLMDMWNIIVKENDFNCEYVIVDSNIENIGKKIINIETIYSEAINKFIDSDCTILLGDFVVTRGRTKIIDFSRTIVFDKIHLLYHRNHSLYDHIGHHLYVIKDNTKTIISISIVIVICTFIIKCTHVFFDWNKSFDNASNIVLREGRKININFTKMILILLTFPFIISIQTNIIENINKINDPFYNNMKGKKILSSKSSVLNTMLNNVGADIVYTTNENLTQRNWLTNYPSDVGFISWTNDKESKLVYNSKYDLPYNHIAFVVKKNNKKILNLINMLLL